MSVSGTNRRPNFPNRPRSSGTFLDARSVATEDIGDFHEDSGKRRLSRGISTPSTSGRRTFADQSRKDVDIRWTDLTRIKQVPGDRGHRGVVSAELTRGDPEINLSPCAHRLQLITKPCVRSHAPSHTERFAPGFLECLFALSNEDVHDRLLKTGCEIV